MGKFARAQAALIRRQKAANPATITYLRRATSAVITGWFGRGMANSQTDSGARVEISDREFFLTVADMEAAGFGDPREGDRLTVDGEAGTWEVLPTSTGERAWRFSDSERTFYRVHTKQVK